MNDDDSYYNEDEIPLEQYYPDEILNSFTKEEKKDLFAPDPALKYLFMGIGHDKLIALINELLGTNYPLDSQVLFENTEHFEILGTLDKSSVRGDLIVQLNPKDDDEIKEKKEQKKKKVADDEQQPTNRTNKIVIEFQSTSDKSMGFRLFVYSINVADIVQRNGKNVYVFPKAITIYVTFDVKDDYGEDSVFLEFEKYKISNPKYPDELNHLIELKFPYINIARISIDDLNSTPLDILQAVYLYRYKKKPELLKKENLKQNLTKLIDNLSVYNNKYSNVIGHVFYNSLSDIVKIIENNDHFKEESDILKELSLTPAGMLVAQGVKKGELEFILNMLNFFNNDQIAIASKKSIEEIQKIREEYSK